MTTTNDIVCMLKIAADAHSGYVRELFTGAYHEIERLRAELAEYKRLYEHRGEVLKRPCMECGYVPRVIELQAKK